MSYVKSLQFMIFTTYTDLSGLTADDGQFSYCQDSKVFYQYNSTANTWTPSSKTTVKKSSTLVTGTSIGTTSIYTLESSNLNFYPIMVIFRAVTISGVTLKPTVSIGTNSTAYDNISSASLLNTVLSTVGANGGLPQMATTSIPLSGGTIIKANVSIAAISTNYTFNVEVIGFYDV